MQCYNYEDDCVSDVTHPSCCLVYVKYKLPINQSVLKRVPRVLEMWKIETVLPTIFVVAVYLRIRCEGTRNVIRDASRLTMNIV